MLKFQDHRAATTIDKNNTHGVLNSMGQNKKDFHIKNYFSYHIFTSLWSLKANSLWLDKKKIKKNNGKNPYNTINHGKKLLKGLKQAHVLK